jgi:hypothetical protein
MTNSVSIIIRFCRPFLKSFSLKHLIEVPMPLTTEILFEKSLLPLDLIRIM